MAHAYREFFVRHPISCGTVTGLVLVFWTLCCGRLGGRLGFDVGVSEITGYCVGLVPFAVFTHNRLMEAIRRG